MRALFRVILAASLVACSPTLDWREVQAEGLAGLLPCRPSTQTRRVTLAGEAVQMTIRACDAGGVTWALASADVGQPLRVAPVLEEMGRAAQRNIGAPAAQATPMAVPGATAGNPALRLRMDGQRPDGAPVQLDVALFSKGTLVYQATAVGRSLGKDALETFFGALRIAP